MRNIAKLILLLPLFSAAWLGAAAAQEAAGETPVAEPAARKLAALQDVAAANPQDPFVRGLKRLDEKLRLQREAEELARRALELQREAERRAEQEALGIDVEDEALVEEEVVIPAPISDPDFFTAFAARKYRLDGLVLSRPQSQPTIHILEEVRKPIGGELFWSGRETALGLCAS